MFKAFNGDLRCYAALRVIPHSVFPNKDLSEQFSGEVRIAAGLRHPRLASVFPLGSFEDAYIYATEFCDGETVADLMARAGCLSPATALTVASQIAAALDSASAEGLFHRKITAANIMLVQEEEEEVAAKLLDLGLPWRDFPREGAEPATRCDLRSPQEVADDAIDARSGIYSLGGLLYCMLAGRENYELLRANIIANERDLANDSDCGASELGKILQRTLCQDPDARVQTFPELREMIEAAMLEPDAPIPAPSPPSRKTVVQEIVREPPSEPPPGAPEPIIEAEAVAATGEAGALTIPTGLLGTAQSGTVLILSRAGAEGGPAAMVYARDSLRIGRAITTADIVTRFLPRSPENDAKTKELSKVHVTAKYKDGKLLLVDGDGLRPSANGSAFGENALSASTPILLQSQGELLLADEYSIKVTPLLTKEEAPVIANAGDWGGPTKEHKGRVSGAVLFERNMPGEIPVVWLFSVASFGSSAESPLDFGLPAGERGAGAVRHYRGCFWIEQRSGESLRVDDVVLNPAGIAPLATGQILGIGDARYSVQVG